MESTDQILKQDATGRVWTPRAQRDAALDAFERSGLPATRFAAQIGVKYQTFVAWKQKRRKERAASSADGGARSEARPMGGWIEAMVAEPGSGSLLVHLPGGARLELRDAGQALLAAQLLRALEICGAARC